MVRTEQMRFSEGEAPDNMRRRARDYTIWFLVFALAMIVSITWVHIGIDLGPDNWLVFLSFVAIGIFGFIGLYKGTAERPYTLNSAHWVFVIFFFFYAPIVQFLSHQSPIQNDVGAFNAINLEANGIILVWCALYAAAYGLAKKMKMRSANKGEAISTPTNDSPNYFAILSLVFVASVAAVIIYGLTGLTSRYDAGVAASDMDSPTRGIIGHFCRYIPILCFCLVLMHKRSRNLLFWAAIVPLAGASFLTDDPISLPRTLAGTIAIAVIATLIRRRRQSGLWLPICLVLGLILLMPVLNLDRNTSFSQINWAAYTPTDIQTTLDGGDFDAYQMLCDTIYMPSDQLTWGNQLLGNVLFFIPRSIWPDKSIGSGNFVGDYYNLPFVNFSEPLPAEGYLNFGFLGVVLFALIFGFIVGWTDQTYWRLMDTRPDFIPPTVLQLCYVFLIGLMIYIMRGALQVALQDIVAFFAAAWLVLKVGYPGILRRRRAHMVVDTGRRDSRSGPLVSGGS